jgi:multidrug transporter EmrE-like cation transporter
MEAQKKNRRYRFGTVFGVCVLVSSLCYLWVAIEMLPKDSAFAVGRGFSAVLAVVTGVGLLRKRYYGVFLLNLAILAVLVNGVAETYPWDSFYKAVPVVVFVACAVPVVVYFQRRLEEFKVGPFMSLFLGIASLRWIESADSKLKWTYWAGPGGMGYAIAALISFAAAIVAGIWTFHVTPHWWLAIPAALLAWFASPALVSVLWAVIRIIIERLEGSR